MLSCKRNIHPQPSGVIYWKSMSLLGDCRSRGNKLLFRHQDSIRRCSASSLCSVPRRKSYTADSLCLGFGSVHTEACGELADLFAASVFCFVFFFFFELTDFCNLSLSLSVPVSTHALTHTNIHTHACTHTHTTYTHAHTHQSCRITCERSEPVRQRRIALYKNDQQCGHA